ncbi:MAG: copper oxidase [Acidobacteria bacterium]|nr:copper oxidase [Acidobacteriota bacterium]MCI0718771.1 copper oxidase [Acidobacteriota bacterium]
MSKNRRDFFRGIGSMGAGIVVGKKVLEAQEDPHAQHKQHMQHSQRKPSTKGVKPEPGAAKGQYLPVETPDVPKLPWKMVDGVKEFHLVAEPVRTEFVPGRVVDPWGYNGSVPGPTIEANEGDRVRVVFDNHLPEMTTVHWHGFEVPMNMDGVPGLGQDPVMPGGRYVYEFTLHQHGTFFYHSHFAMQEMAGMIGLFIMHPKEPYQPRVHRDFGLILQEWALLPNNTVPNTLAMEFNWLTINGKAGPACTPMLARLGERVRLRIVNLGMDHHPMHLHGNTWVVTGTEGGRVPEGAWTPGNTEIVGVAQARTMEFEAKYVGDWMLHCHLPHHMMNQMVSMVGPISHVGHGMHTGMSMENGMGMLRDGNALSEDFGPSFGRDIGESAQRERAVTHLVGSPIAVQKPQKELPPQQPPLQGHEGHKMQGHEGHQTPGGDVMYPVDDPVKKQVPGYPQDMWMDMSQLVPNKPEFHGLRPTWDRAMMGMMTLVRVLPPELYDKIIELKQQEPEEGKKPTEAKPLHQHKH